MNYFERAGLPPFPASAVVLEWCLDSGVARLLLPQYRIKADLQISHPQVFVQSDTDIPESCPVFSAT
jgi:hypothetical protein